MPQWNFEWNLNTIVVFLGFAGGLIAWGYTLSELQQGRLQNNVAIEKLETRMEVAEQIIRRIDNHELRITATERQVTESLTSVRAIENSMSNLAADLRVMREILQRLEQRRAAVPSPMPR